MVDTDQAMWLNDDSVRALSKGEVTSADSYSYVSFLPVEGGLYCPSIFGEIGWKRKDLRALTGDARSDRCGHLELGAAIPRPDGPARRVILVLPPVHRQFRLLSAEEHRSSSRARRAELLALSKTEEWPYCDPVDKLLAEEGLTDPAAIDALDEGAVEPPLNIAYRAVINQAQSLRRLGELGAPTEVLNECRERLRSACIRVDVELERRRDIPNPLKLLGLGRSG